jgi:hypothetical protein
MIRILLGWSGGSTDRCLNATVSSTKGDVVRRFAVVLLGVSFWLCLTGCGQETVAPPAASDASITVAEARGLLMPVYKAIAVGDDKADSSLVSSAVLEAFALTDGFSKDIEPFVRVIDELDKKHGPGTEPAELVNAYRGLGPRLTGGLAATQETIASSDDAGLWGVIWPVRVKQFGQADLTAQEEALCYLSAEYTSPAGAASLDGITFAVEPQNTIVVTFTCDRPRGPGTTTATVYTVRYLAERRDGAWKIVGLQDVAALVKARDDAMIAGLAKLK